MLLNLGRHGQRKQIKGIHGDPIVVEWPKVAKKRRMNSQTRSLGSRLHRGVRAPSILGSHCFQRCTDLSGSSDEEQDGNAKTKKTEKDLCRPTKNPWPIPSQSEASEEKPNKSESYETTVLWIIMYSHHIPSCIIRRHMAPETAGLPNLYSSHSTLVQLLRDTKQFHRSSKTASFSGSGQVRTLPI
jgi:hypothetical protein